MIFTRSFLVKAFEAGLQSGAAAFTGSLFFTSGTPSVKSLAAGGIGAGVAFLYTFVKEFGAVAATKAAADKKQ